MSDHEATVRRVRTARSASRRAVLRTLGVGGFGVLGVGAGVVGVGGVEARTRKREDERGREQEQGTWRTGPPMPDERTEVGAAALDGELHVVGGFVSSEASDRGGVTAGVAIFDPTAEEWRTADPTPEPRHHAAAVALDGDVYVVGGFCGRGFDPVDSVWRYDGSEWEERARLPTPRGGLVAEAIDGRIYAAGGEDADGSLATMAVYDPEADEWAELASMPTARNHLASGAVGGKLYAVGGRTGFSDLLGANEAYDPEADEWTELAPMPTPRGGLAGAALNGRVFAAGGEGPGGTFEEVEAYDPAADEWARVSPLPTARHGLGVAAIDGDLYTAAGGPSPGFAFSDALEVFRPSASGETTER